MFILRLLNLAHVKRTMMVIALYALSASAVGYFVHHAHNGERGLKIKQELLVQIRELEAELSELKNTKKNWGAKLSMLQDEGVDKDLLDERVRATLGRVHKSDVVIITKN